MSKRVISRRQSLALVAAAGAGGGFIGYLHGSGYFDDECDTAPVNSAPTDWTSPNYDGANSRSVPSESAPDELTERWRVSWSTSSPAPPVVANGSIFVVPEIHAAKRLVSYDLHTGELEWRRILQNFTRSKPVVAGDRLILPREHVDDDTVSVGLATADGEELWTAGSSRIQPQIESGMMLSRFGREGFSAVDVRTGETCWSKDVNRVHSTVTDNESVVILNAATDGRLLALDTQSGEELWQSDVSEFFRNSSLSDYIRSNMVVGEHVYVHTFGGHLLALETGSGDLVWTEKTESEDGNWILQPVAYSQGVLFAIEERQDNSEPDTLYALYGENGDEIWRFEMAEFNPPVVAGDTVYLPSHNSDGSELLLLNRGDGDIKESHQFDLSSMSVVLGDGTCILSSHESLVALG